MSDVNFGNIAIFFSASDTLEPDASYDGRNAQQDQTRHSIACLRQYFKDHCPIKPIAKSKMVAENSAPLVDDFFLN